MAASVAVLLALSSVGWAAPIYLGDWNLGNASLGGEVTPRDSMAVAENGELRFPVAQEQFGSPDGNRSIFQRFSAGRDTSKTWQTAFEVPVGLYPQTDPSARILINEGLGWVTSYQPLNRIYFGRSISYAHMEWEPGGQLSKTEVVEWEWTEILNIAVQPWWVISAGLGAGFMDGLIFYKDGGFQHRLEVFLPIQVGTGFRLGQRWFVDAKLVQSSYFGSGPVASASRSLIGVGYNY